MTVLQDLKKNLVDGHSISIEPISEYRKEHNAEFENVKDIYVIKIHHPDESAGIFFSKYAKHYSDIVKQILDTYSKGKLYSVCTTECGYDLQFDIVWNKNRKLK